LRHFNIEKANIRFDLASGNLSKRFERVSLRTRQFKAGRFVNVLGKIIYGKFFIIDYVATKVQNL